MDLTVQLHRQTKEEPDHQTIRAYVLQDGRRGGNVLRRWHISSVETAMRRVTEELRVKFGACEITFVGEDGETPAPEPANNPPHGQARRQYDAPRGGPR
jgi:hypothetical protein